MVGTIMCNHMHTTTRYNYLDTLQVGVHVVKDLKEGQITAPCKETWLNTVQLNKGNEGGLAFPLRTQANISQYGTYSSTLVSPVCVDLLQHNPML